MKLAIALVASAALLSACQEAERGVGGDGSPSADDMNLNESEDVLAERELDDVANVGADLINGESSNMADDINLPAGTRFATFYLGSYGPAAGCTGNAKVLELDQTNVSYDGIDCAVGDITANGEAINVAASSCMAGNRSVADRTYTLNLATMSELRVSGATTGTLVRCGSSAR